MERGPGLMSEMHASPPRPLDEFRAYLRVLAQTHYGQSGINRADASDVVQEALLRAHAAREQFQGRTSGEQAVWLRTILARVMADAARRAGRRPMQSLEAALEETSLRLERWTMDDGASPLSN